MMNGNDNDNLINIDNPRHQRLPSPSTEPTDAGVKEAGTQPTCDRCGSALTAAPRCPRCSAPRCISCGLE